MSSNFDHIVQPTDVKAQMIISVISYATMLEGQFSEWLAPAPVGVYMPGNFDPSLVPNRQYYTFDRGVWAMIVSMDDIKTDVYDANHKLVLNRFVMQNKERFLTTHPTIPVRGIRLIQKLIEYEITTMLRWCSHARGCENRILSEFRPDYRNSVDISLIREACRFITAQVHDFIGSDDWNYYHTRIVGPDILIEKGPDYRICEWYQMKNQEQDNGY